jgi:hypothetical protein
MTTNYQALALHLRECVDGADGNWARVNIDALLDVAENLERFAALAQPEAVGPTDEQLKVAYWEAFVEAAPCGADESWLAGLRAVARLGRPAITPIPLSERPWERDGWCDSGGCCWMGDAGGCGFVPSWRLCKPSDSCLAWCLPAHALPLPTTDG